MDRGWLRLSLPCPVLRLLGRNIQKLPLHTLGAGTLSSCWLGTGLEGVAERTGIYERSQ